MLINLSNHPSCNWGPDQLNAAARYGDIIDLPFPEVAPEGDESYIEQLVSSTMASILQYASKEEVTVHIMGEMTFVYLIVNCLSKIGIPCLASTTRRIAQEADNIKISDFRFVRFRNYGTSTEFIWSVAKP